MIMSSPLLGGYLLDIYNVDNIKKACFYVSVGDITLKGNKIKNVSSSSNTIGTSWGLRST